MVELDYDQVLEELINFSKKSDVNEFPDLLERYLQMVAKNGDIVFPWRKVKPFLRRKLEMVMESFYRQYPLNDSQLQVPNCDAFEYESFKGNILEYFHYFNEAPFTIQRLCELLTEPDKHYKRVDKFMRGLSKTMIVISSVQPRPNKYVPLESIEKQQTFRDLYPHFNVSSNNGSGSSPLSNHLSSSSTTSGSPTSLLNGVDVTQHSNSTHFDSQYGSVVHLHSSGGTFYGENTSPQSSASSLLNTAHHHGPHLLDHSPLGAPDSLHHNHSPLQSHQLVSATLAPLQQLDSFTNVFASNTTGHLTHLTNSTYSLANTHLSSRRGLLGSESEGRGSVWQPTASERIYDSLLHGDQLNNDENENIIVDDDYDEEDEEGNTASDEAKEGQTGLADKGAEEKGNQDSSSSSCSSNSDSNESFPEKSPLEADKSASKEETLDSNDSGSCSSPERLSDDEQGVCERKRIQSEAKSESVEMATSGQGDELPLTPKKIKTQPQECGQTADAAESEQQVCESVTPGPSHSSVECCGEEEVRGDSIPKCQDTNVPMELAGSGDSSPPSQMQVESATVPDVPMSVAEEEEPEEPMDQE